MTWQVLVTAIMGIATIGAGIWQFTEDSERRAENARFTAQQPFLTKQMDLCLEATEAAAPVASSTDEERWYQAKERFWTLYWGPLSVVERPLTGDLGPVEGKWSCSATS